MRDKDAHGSRASARAFVPQVGRRSAPRVLGVMTVATWALLAACGAPSVGAAGLPDRPPDVQGRVAGEPGSAYLVEASPIEGGAWWDTSDGYFEGMSLGGGSAEDGTVVASRDDRTLTRSDLAAGDLVEVWIGDGCGESSPVTCEVVAIRVTAHAG